MVRIRWRELRINNTDSPKLSDADKKIFNRIATDENFICNVANKYYITDSPSELEKTPSA